MRAASSRSRFGSSIHGVEMAPVNCQYLIGNGIKVSAGMFE